MESQDKADDLAPRQLLYNVMYYALLYVVAFLSAAAEVYSSSINEDLVLDSGDVLNINTTVPEAEYNVHRNGDPNPLMISLKDEIAKVGGKSWPYKYAELVFDGDVVLARGSIVNVSGKYGLSVQSMNGNITISSNIIMTCAVNAVGMDMCLGGYAQRLECDAMHFVPGAGPGCASDGSALQCDYLSYHSPKGAAGHGGKAAKANTPAGSFLFGWFYERENIATLIGGSSGWHEKKRFLKPRSGGGAIELRADNGAITLYSIISANAQHIPSKTETYGGSSGGRIRLKAREVILQPQSRLEVDGSPGGIANTSNCNENEFVSAGGAGGVIQIIAASIKIKQIAAISMKPGSSARTKLMSDPGFLLITDYSGRFYETWNSSWSFPNASISFGKMPEETVKYCPPNSLGTHLTPMLRRDPTDEQIRQIHLRSSCLKNESGSIDPLELADYFRGLVTDFHHVVTNQSLTKSQLDESVEALTEVKDIYIILASTSAIQSPSLWDLFNNVSRVVDDMLDPRNKKIWNNSKLIIMLDLMDVVSEIATGKALQSTHGTVARLSFQGTNMAIQIMKYSQPDFQDLALPINTRRCEDTSSHDSVIVRREAIETILTPTDDVSVVIKVYEDVENIFPRDVDSSISDKQITQISHLVAIAILISNKSVSVLFAPIFINFVLQKPALKESTPHCVYWNKAFNAWKNDGVKLVSTNETHVQCSTNHLTSFAVLFSTTNTKIPEDHAFALDLLTYICCGLSIAALFVTLIIFYSIEALSSDRHRIHMHLALSILLSQLLFLTGIDATKYRVLCGIVAACLHYLFLASFSWMFVEGFHLYMKIVRVYRTESMRMLYYYIFGWGFPVVFVVSAASIHSSGYGTKQACWLSLQNSFIWMFIGPVAIIALANLIILVMVIKVVVTSADILESQRAKIVSGVKGASMLLPLLGVTWVFGLLIVEDNSIVFHYIFTITNSLQGFFIFSFHCVGNSEVRTALRRFRERKFDFNSVFVQSNGDEVNSVPRKNATERVDKSKVYPLKKIPSQ